MKKKEKSELLLKEAEQKIDLLKNVFFDITSKKPVLDRKKQKEYFDVSVERLNKIINELQILF